jgi:hypothetical protein
MTSSPAGRSTDRAGEAGRHVFRIRPCFGLYKKKDVKSDEDLCFCGEVFLLVFGERVTSAWDSPAI